LPLRVYRAFHQSVLRVFDWQKVSIDLSLEVLVTSLNPAIFCRLPASLSEGAKIAPPSFARPTAARIALVTSQEPSVEALTDSHAREATVKQAMDEHEKDLQVFELRRGEGGGAPPGPFCCTVHP
jgi:hypothetical protein